MSSSSGQTTEAQLQQYLAKHKVAETLQKLVERLCIEQPDDAIDFMISYLQQLKQTGEYNVSTTSDDDEEDNRNKKLQQGEEGDNLAENEEAEEHAEADNESDDTKDDEAHLIDERRAELIRRRYSTTHTRRDAFSSESVDPDEEYQPVRIPKTEDEKRRLSEALSSNVLFSHLEPDELKIIFDAMFERTYAPGEVIIQQGDEGDNFYVVDYGVCDVIKDVGNGVKQKVATVQPGGSFGELALIYNQPRAATVKAVTEVRVWAIDRTTYRRILLGATIKKRKLYEEFLSRVDILQNLTDYERLTLADALQPANYADGEVIVRQDDPGDSFFIVAEGTVKVEKKLPDNRVIQIGTLGTGAIFGELALLFNQPRAATVKAVGPVKCLTLDRKSFQRILGPFENILKRNVETYNEIVAKLL